MFLTMRLSNIPYSPSAVDEEPLKFMRVIGTSASLAPESSTKLYALATMGSIARTNPKNDGITAVLSGVGFLDAA